MGHGGEAVTGTMPQHTPGRQDVLDTAHSVLANPRQRRIVQFLGERPGPVALEELADRLSEVDGPRSAMADPDRLLVWLHHASLPRLVGTGVVEQVDGGIALTPLGRLVATIGRSSAREVEEWAAGSA